MKRLKPPRSGISIVDSPDDGGVYLEEYDLDAGTERVSRIYPDRAAAVDAMRRNAVDWETEPAPATAPKRASKAQVTKRALALEVELEEDAGPTGGTLYAYAPKRHVFTATGTHLVVAVWDEREKAEAWGSILGDLTFETGDGLSVDSCPDLPGCEVCADLEEEEATP
jgi:hypothetical protein